LEQFGKQADDPDTEFVKVSRVSADKFSMETPSTGSGPAARPSRRSKRPPSSRRRAELALGRSMSNRRVLGGAIAVALVLAVPGASVLPNSDTATTAGRSGGATEPAIRGSADSRRISQPELKPAAAASTKKPAGTARLTNHLSGLPWVSGVYARGQGVAGVKRFGAWRGAPVDVVVDWPARQTWDDIVNPAWLYNIWKNTPYTKAFGVAPVPEGDASATMAGCAAGLYNSKWRQFGANIKAAGLDDETVIRLGWEFNGDWYKWQAKNPRQFVSCWRQIVRSAEQTAPALLWEWTVNRGKGASVVDARKAYPGDAYVDIVGIDSYDMWPGVTSEADWARQYSGPYGLKFWSDFARSRGKKVSVPEWAVYPANAGSNGGDNAFYISKMRGFFKSQGSHLAYEAYFNESAAYVSGSLFGPTQNPAAAARYRSLFRR